MSVMQGCHLRLHQCDSTRIGPHPRSVSLAISALALYIAERTWLAPCHWMLPSCPLYDAAALGLHRPPVSTRHIKQPFPDISASPMFENSISITDESNKVSRASFLLPGSSHHPLFHGELVPGECFLQVHAKSADMTCNAQTML